MYSPFRSVLLLTVGSLAGMAALGAPSITMPSVNPASLTVGLSALVTASCRVSTAATDPALLPGGVDLVRLTSTGTAVSTLGVMHDDGLNGDAQAGDGIFTLQFTTNESAAGQFEVQCTAAFKGLLQRIKSPAATVTVLAGAGTIGLPTVSPSSIAYAAPTAVTITASVTGATPDSGSVMLQRLDSSGRVLAILGGLHDDGLDGDAVPGDGIFTLVTTFTEFAVGTVPLRVSATFSGAVSHVFSPIATLMVTGTPPPTVTISAPANLSYLSLSPTTVNGTVSDPQATVVINSIPVAISNGAFSASIPLAEGPNILTATATSASGSVGTASIQVNLDTTPPHVTITSPADQFVTSSSTFSIAGNVNDIVVGTVNSQQVHVTVNGIAAQVGNRTFLAQNIPLSLGPNVIQAVAVDQAGNSATTQITVTRQAPQPGQIQVVSGNNQTATIGSVLPAPLVVTLTDSNGNPAANKPVIFSVTQNNGMLSSNGSAPAASVLVNTNAQGQVTANWTLGMRAGAGSDGVQAYSVGFGGTAVFTATANQGTPGLIVVDSGNNQTGAVNQQLPKPLIAVVIDAGHNRLAGVPVTFTVLQGGGSIAGQAAVTVTTDSDGRAAVTPTLGFQEGSANNLISATFASNAGFPASFSASGLGPGNPANTVISGLVLDNSNQPVPGVTVRALLTNALTSSAASTQTAATATSDATGHFSISPAPVGYVKLLVDGSTANTEGTFPSLEYDMVTVTGNINTVNQPIYLLPIKTNNQLCVTATTGGGTLTIPEAPGFSLTFGPGQVTFPGGSMTGCVSVTSVHPDKVPMVPGFGQQPRFIVTIQPSGALFNPPAPITIPNVDGLKAREVTEMYSYDHDISSFVAIGTGTVSDDGQTIRSNSGIGVLKAGWHCGGNPNIGGAAATCGPCAHCDGTECQANPVQNPPANCQNPCITGGGTCDASGHCVGINEPKGFPCGSSGSCDGSGNCVWIGSNGGCPGGCNSGNPCITDSCLNNQCVATANQLCKSACGGRTSGPCAVGNLSGTCDSSGNCNLCASLGAGASCSCGNSGFGTCDNAGQCNCCSQNALAGFKIDSTSISVTKSGSSYSISSPQATTVSIPGVYAWSSTNPNITILGSSSGRGLTTIQLLLSGPGKTTLTVSFAADCGISAQDSVDLVLTSDITVIGFIDGSQVPLPTTGSPELVNALNGSATCATTLLNWAALGDGQPLLPLTPTPPSVDTPEDILYANSFLIHESADPSWGSLIDPNGIESQPHSLQEFRAYNRFQAFYTVRNGLIEPDLQPLQSTTIAGITPDPCELGERTTLGLAELHPLNGRLGIDPTQRYVFQINQARLGLEGQATNTYINHRGNPVASTTPWIWSVIEFDTQGQILAPIPTQIFPSYVVYDGGVQIRRIVQAPILQFISLDASSQFRLP